MEIYVGILGAEAGKRPCKESMVAQRTYPQSEPPPPEASQLFHFSLHFHPPRQHRLRVSVDDLAGRRQPAAVACAVKELHSQLIFQLLHSLAYRRLRCKEGLCSI